MGAKVKHGRSPLVTQLKRRRLEGPEEVYMLQSKPTHAATPNNRDKFAMLEECR